MRHFRLVFVSLIGLSLCGCSIRSSIVVNATRPLIENAMISLLMETDPELAKIAMASDLKLLEGMLLSKPDDQKLLLLAAKGFTGYAMLFFDPQSPDQARNFYLRAKEYSLKALSKTNRVFIRANATYEEFERAVKEMGRKDIEGAYWTAVAWSGWINLSRGSPDAAAEFPRARILMERVMEIDPLHENAGPQWFFGVYYSTLPPILGGDPAKSKQFFERGIDATNGAYLWGKLLFAQTYAVQTLDRGLFDRLLGEVIAGSINEKPEFRLLNRVAAQKANEAIQRAGELF